MSPFWHGYTDAWNGVEDNPYPQEEQRVAYRQGYDRGIFEYACLVETQDQGRDEHET